MQIAGKEEADDHKLKIRMHFICLYIQQPKPPKIEKLVIKKTNDTYWHFGELHGEGLSIGTNEISLNKAILADLISLNAE